MDDPHTAVDDVAETTAADHGRIESRRAEVVHDVAWLATAHGFPSLRAVGKVTAKREVKGQSTTATRSYLLSTPLSAARFAAVVRTHWHIENRLDKGSTRAKIRRTGWDDAFLLKILTAA